MSKTKKMRIMWSALLMAGILSCLAAGREIYAKNAIQISIDQYDVTEDGYVQVYVNHNGAESFTPSAADGSVLVGKNTLPIEEIRKFADMGEPVTYLCLIDISGSMTDDGIASTKEVLSELVQEKGAQDNICITTMGNDVTSSGFLTDAAKLTENIEAIERVSTEDTNLYYGITEALNVLKTDKAVCKKRCLLIFSDGEDDQKKGITEEEAQTAVKDSHIPIFAVALEGRNLKDAEGSRKTLGSFARNSAGGECYIPFLEDEYDYADICGKILTRVKSSYVVSASLEGVKEAGDDTVYIGVELSDGTEKASDGITVPVGKILDAIEAIEAAKESTEINYTIINGQEEKEETEAQDKPLGKYAAVGIGLLLLVIILAVIMLLGKKKTEQEETDEDAYGDLAGAAAWTSQDGSSGDVQTMMPGDMPAVSPGQDSSAREKRKKGKDKIEITLYKVGPGESESYKVTVKGEADIGRNSSCHLSFADDSALSGRHCSLLYRDGIVLVRDENSTNGTFVNGVPIVGEFVVNRDDVLLIGSSEYRIVWE